MTVGSTRLNGMSVAVLTSSAPPALAELTDLQVAFPFTLYVPPNPRTYPGNLRRVSCHVGEAPHYVNADPLEEKTVKTY